MASYGKWVLYAADGKYLIGNFDGKEFHPDGDKQQVWFGNFYAAQSFILRAAEIDAGIGLLWVGWNLG